jgi:hypothetical protein
MKKNEILEELGKKTISPDDLAEEVKINLDLHLAALRSLKS